MLSTDEALERRVKHFSHMVWPQGRRAGLRSQMSMFCEQHLQVKSISLDWSSFCDYDEEETAAGIIFL